MRMRVAVPREIRDGEKRVALVPDVINKLTRLGYEVVIESGAGVHSQATDDLYTAAGAIVKSGNVIGDADVVDPPVSDDAASPSCSPISDLSVPINFSINIIKSSISSLIEINICI